MSAARFGVWVGLGRRQLREASLPGAAELEHDLAEHQKDNAPPEVHVDAEAASVKIEILPGSDAESGEDDADEREHQSHGDAQIETHRFSSGEEDIQGNG